MLSNGMTGGVALKPEEEQNQHKIVKATKCREKEAA